MHEDLRNRYRGDLRHMLAAYNWGLGNVDRQGLGRAPPETRRYIRKVAEERRQCLRETQAGP